MFLKSSKKGFHFIVILQLLGWAAVFEGISDDIVNENLKI
jgi:hypothetical protein